MLLVGWGCTVDESDLGSNRAGTGGDGGGAGTAAGKGGSAQAGAGAAGGAGNAGNAGKGGGTAGGDAGAPSGSGGQDASGGGAGDSAGAGAGGAAGAPDCGCPLPPVLGGECCSVPDACVTEGLGCEELRAAVVALREADSPDDPSDSMTLRECEAKVSAALVAGCAFVPPECGEPAEDYATFGDPAEGGYSECTEAETRAALRCGEPGSSYGLDCCQRQRCYDHSECASGRCIFRRAQSESLDPFGYPHMTECELRGSGCSCGGLEVGEPHNGYCIGEDEDISRFDCDVASRSCHELESWDNELSFNLRPDGGFPLSDAAIAAYSACRAKISDERDERCVGDCRETGCEAGYSCQGCLGPDLDSHFVCLPEGTAC